MSKSREFSHKAIENLGYYVYIYSDPDTKIPFYIGKGKGNRCFNHLFLDNDSEKVAKIQEILSQGKEPIIEILVHGVDEETALKVEAAAIDLIGIDNLSAEMLVDAITDEETEAEGQFREALLSVIRNTKGLQKKLFGYEFSDDPVSVCKIIRNLKDPKVGMAVSLI